MQLIWVMVLATLINVLLLLAAAGFTGGRIPAARLVLASVSGAILTGITMLPDVTFFQSVWWRLLVLLLTAVLANGIHPENIGKTLLFCLLHLSLGGLTSLRDQPASQLLGAAGICLACYLTTERKKGIQVEIPYTAGILKLTALYDTGNTLRDPITGRSVLVVDADIAKKLTGLSPRELAAPMQTMAQHPGFQLIPIKTVSKHDFLLAQKLPKVKIGNWQGSALVAFSSQTFGSSYQALTGGM